MMESDAQPPVKRRRGSVHPWGGRFQEIQDRFAAKHPLGKLDPDFLDKDLWAEKVPTGPQARITGVCTGCNVRFSRHPTELLREEYERLPNCRCQRESTNGKVGADWSERQAEFLRRFGELHPTGVLDTEFADPASWATRVRGSGVKTKVSGHCRSCAGTFSSDLGDLINKHRPKLSGCGCTSASSSSSQRNRESYRREAQTWSNRRAEFFATLSGSRPSLQLDAAADTDEAWKNRLAEKGGQTVLEGTCSGCGEKIQKTLYLLLAERPHCRARCGQRPDGRSDPASRASSISTGGGQAGQDQQAVLAMMRERHPRILLDPKFLNPVQWRSLGVRCSTNLEGTCLDCGASVTCTIMNAKKQGFGQCDCKGLAKARAVAEKKFGAGHEITSIRFQNFGGQRYAVVDSFCHTCGWESSGTQVRTNRGLPCECNNQARWKSPAGYKKILEVIESNKKLEHVEPAFDQGWWEHNVVNTKTPVPLRCTKCGAQRAVQITSIQQGNGMGCACRRSCEQLEAQLESWGLKFEQEVKVATNASSGRALLADYHIVGSTPPVYLELDGPKHFTGRFNNQECAASGVRDVLKEKAIVGSGGILIRIDQRSVWLEGWENYLRLAFEFAAEQAHAGTVLHPDHPCYTEASAYVDAHNPTEAGEGGPRLLAEIPFEGARIRVI